MSEEVLPFLQSMEGSHPQSRRITQYRGAYGAARAWVVAEIARQHPRVLVVCKNRSTVENLLADLAFFSPSQPVRWFPSWETLPFESVSPTADVSGLRLRVAYECTQRAPLVVVTSIDALQQTLPPQEYILSLTTTVRVGDSVGLDTVAARLRKAGYLQCSLVEEAGEMSAHGLVIDVFPAGSPLPFRLEFDAERLTGIRVFDADSQRSCEHFDEVVLPPAREAVPLSALAPEEHATALDRLRSRAAELGTPPRELTRIVDALQNDTDFPGRELISPLLLGRKDSLGGLLASDTVVVQIDQFGTTQALDSLYETIEERAQRLASEHYLIPPSDMLFLSPNELRKQLSAFDLSLIDDLEVFGEFDTPITPISVRSEANTELITKLRTQVGTGDALAPLKQYLNRHRARGYDVAFVVGSTPRAERLKRILLNLDIDAKTPAFSASQWLTAPHRYPVVILQGHLSDGFLLHDQQLLLIGEHEVFAERSYRTSRKAKTSLKRLMGTLSLLKEGDFVVHTDFGVGRYHGLTNREVEGVSGDFLHIEYADSVLFLPVQSIAKVQKFVASEGAVPQLDKLGSTRWIKTKQKVREQVATLAGDLIRLYASRSVIKGWRFDPPGAEDDRFAEHFPYDETPDQDKAIQDTYQDLAADRPMDRLVCGDVGFGKTEVAIRAAYKCVQHARQVAVLVPTTILAEQHFESFSRRFKGYPVQLGIVSRFHSSEENKETLRRLAFGELDIVVGTHRLLSRDVQFKDLGLLIIDEEHRFGVQQKERLKSLKKSVDVLTLTATPIPRTLHMSLLGIRDISLISTPPVDRRVIRTYVAAYDEALIRDVLLRELQRGGQAFFVHNRVQNIEAIVQALQKIVPEARYGYAHGQMSERQLEPIMRRFIDKEIDVLIATSIIESGIDIPNANTILIDRADTFGLAQLYQLRGRVGRSSRQAFCYFLIPKSRSLSGEAQQRLKALQALDDLGLGFNLAMRDLEIRGAGNLLGKEQSGSVLAVGFELYSKILKEAILNLKGEEVDFRESIEPEVKLGIPAFVPEHYLPDVSERLVLYQRFASISTEEEGTQLLEEVRDRFGPVPRETVALAELMSFRAMLREFGVVRAEYKGENLILSFSPQAPIDIDKLFALEKQNREAFHFGKNLSLSVAPKAFPGLPIPVENPESLARRVRLLLEGVRALPTS